MHIARLLTALALVSCSALLPWQKAVTPAPPVPQVATSVTVAPTMGAALHLPREILPGRYAGKVVNRREVALREKVIALTFDDGPNPEITPDVLDLLQRYQAHATFFVVGQFARQWPELVTRAARDGHAIESHSYSHPRTEVNFTHAGVEIDRAQAAIVAATGRVPTLFRPAWGRTDNNMARVARQRGKCVVKWTLCAGDNPRLTAAEIVAAVTRDPRSGDIVLLHDGRDRRQTVRALPEILRRLTDMGYRFVTVPQLLRRWDEALAHPHGRSG